MRGRILSLQAAVLLAIITAPAPAQDLNVSKRSGFASFDLSLAPTLTGSLDGHADLDLRWIDWLETRAEFGALNSQQSTSDAAGDSTRLTTTLSASVEVARVNQELLWRLLPIELDWLRLHAGAMARLVSIDEKRYGMSAGGASFYDVHSSTSYIKPLAVVGGGLDFGSFAAEADYEVSPWAVRERLSGTAIDSSGSTPTTTPFTGSDIGLESRIAGKARLDFGAVGVYGRGEYFRHIGYNRYVSGGVAKPYAYTTVDLLIGGGVKLGFLKISGASPYFGMTWVKRDFEPHEAASGGQASSSSTHWRVDFGLGL